MHTIFQKKGKKRAKKGNILATYWAKLAKFENIMKKGNLMCATITCTKQLEYALIMQWYLADCVPWALVLTSEILRSFFVTNVVWSLWLQPQYFNSKQDLACFSFYSIWFMKRLFCKWPLSQSLRSLRSLYNSAVGS